MQLPKRPEMNEQKMQKWWEEKGFFKFNPNSDKPIYSIDVPPPYASAGHLHVGHALHYTQFEIIVRFKRMRGYNVYFPPCFDNNGLPTEKYVEEKLGISKKDVSRKEFREICLRESRKVEKIYANNVFRRLGHSYDWSLLYTTIDYEAQKVAQWSFIDLYNKGEIYRAKEPTIWCTKHETALAQAEVEDMQRTTTLYTIIFDLVDGGRIEIATTRPELLPACVGIFVHPGDDRYKHLVGKKARVPIFGQEVTIMKDEKVDMEFGTGIVMVCTFGDKTDIEWWKKHKLELRECVTKDGRLKNAGKYNGLKLEEARRAIIEDLKKEGRVVKEEKIQQTVGVCWRCSTPIEFLVTPQWFVKVLEHKQALIEQGRKIKWFPEFFRKRYEDWTMNLSWDWCISRQRYYGVPIPVWYCKKCGRVKLPKLEDLPVDPTEELPKEPCECGSNEFIPEKDVFDTWFTSSLTPQIACKFLENPELYKKLFPMSLRPQAQDIIRTWAFYTILKSYLHFKEIPWKQISLGTFVLDPKGRGMSKSKGNVVWADEILEKYSVDAFRYWVAHAKWGSDIPFKEHEIKAGEKFLTKLWNATRFAFSRIEEKPKEVELKTLDKWILTKLSQKIEEITHYFEEFHVEKAVKELEQFFWHEVCDNYIELVKHRFYADDDAAKYTLSHVILSTIKMLAPICCFITEEIYQRCYKQFENIESIHISSWPKPMLREGDAFEMGEKVKEIISKIRRYKSEHKLAMNAKLQRVTINVHLPQDALEDLKHAANCDAIEINEDQEEIVKIR